MIRLKTISAAILLLLGLATVLQADSKKSVILWEYIGQVTNSGANSAQYGNLAKVVGAPAGSFFTFNTTATTTSVTVDGPLRIIDRTGTTTIYQALAAGDFTNPSSFQSGVPVQTSTLQQQVIVNTTTGDFSVINVNRVTNVSLMSNGETLGEAGDVIRTVLTGQLNVSGTPPPSGWFGGYATK